MKEVEKACIKKLNVLATTVSATNRISIPGRRARESYVKVEKVKSHVRLLSMGGSVRVSRQEVKEKCAWNNPDPPPYLGENFASVFSKTNPFASNPYAELQQTLTLTQTKPDPPSLYFQTPVWNITSGKLHMDQTAPSAPTPATEGKVVPEHVRIMAAPCERANKQLKDEFEEILRTSKTYPDLRLALSEFKTELLRRGNASRSVRDELRQRVLQAEQEAEEHFKTSLKHHEVLEETGVGRMAKDEPLDHENLDRIDGIPKTVVTAMENIPDLAEMTDDRWCSCLRHFLRRHAKEKDTKVDRSPSSH
ncbi:uncharacterized protein [Antennarius striatus]